MYDYIRIRLQGMAKSERGASAVEYGLLVALIAVMIIAAVALIGTRLDSKFDQVGTSLA